MSKAHHDANSEEYLIGEIQRLDDARAAAVHIRTRELTRATLVIRKHFVASVNSFHYTEWDACNGFRKFTTENYNDEKQKGDDKQAFEAISFPLEQLRDDKSPVNLHPDKVHIFAFVDCLPYFSPAPVVCTMIQQYASMLPDTNVLLLFITPDVPFEGVPPSTLATITMPVPSHQELRDSLDSFLNGLEADDDWKNRLLVDDEGLDQIAGMGLGMTLFEFNTHSALALVDSRLNDEDGNVTNEGMLAGIRDGKTEVVKQSDILELFPPASMDDVGGMGALKEWVSDRADSFSDEAREFGIQPPKGIALIGVPGGGKSLVAKAVSGALGVPLIRLDIGRVFSRFVGDSEHRMRTALDMVSRMGRLVLFVDEIDKGLGGIGGGGEDGGVSSRVLGAFLTWMQENESECFVVLTANRIEGLPPEIFRRGRLDGVFSVGLPNRDERREVLEVHLRKRGRSIEDYTPEEVEDFITASDTYLPAEIEAAVKDGLVLAFNQNVEDGLLMDNILAALKKMVPMSVSHRAQMDAIQAWAKDNATPVSLPEKPKDAPRAQVSSIGARRSPRAARPVKE